MAQSVSIGILSSETVSVSFFGRYICGGKSHARLYHFCPSDFLGNLTFIPTDFPECSFELAGVTIGKDFHWQQKECLQFRGSLILCSDGISITAINVIPVEEYLKSVISSEMNPGAPLEFLKAHAIISRTWVMNRILCRRKSPSTYNEGMTETDTERIRWYDDSQHVGFDVCADDHCQRYQGISRITNPKAIQAVEATVGIVLKYNGAIIDARFSKCCGGAFESFENCWQPIHHPYLVAGRDFIDKSLPDLAREEEAAKWIKGYPEAFCKTSDPHILSQVLNDYDLATRDSYRWKVRYSKDELSAIVRARTGVDFGEVTDLIPLQRGVSGRIIKLKIMGSKRTMTIGKELEIRKSLSPSHLYSSAFTVNKDKDSFTLNGAGWGHGVGLCQIGAAMMAHHGFSCEDILKHYYPATSLGHCDE